MRGVKYAMLGLGALSVLLCLIYNVFQYGTHGTLLFVFCLVPTALGGLSIWLKGMPRWASAVSMISFLFAGFKSAGDISSLNNIMVAVFLAMILALALLIVPDRAKKAKQQAQAFAQPQQGYVDPQQQAYAQPQQGYVDPQQQQAYAQPAPAPVAGYEPNGAPQA